MSLQRSPGSLANLHLFFKVERVVYCEGSANLTVADVEAGAGDEETLDVAFWQAVFVTFSPDRKTHFKSIGSKSSLLTIAAQVIANNIPNVIICLDRDFDHYRGMQLNDSRVLYSFGYSWENDVLTSGSLDPIYFGFRNRNANSENDFATLVKFHGRFLSAAKRYCEYDLHFVSNGDAGMFPRDAPQSVISQAAGQVPSLNDTRLKALLKLRGYTRGPRPKVKIDFAEIGHVMFGKVLSKFVFLSVRHFSQPAGNFVQYNNFMRLAIVKFADSLAGNALPQLRNYYSALIPV